MLMSIEEHDQGLKMLPERRPARPSYVRIRWNDRLRYSLRQLHSWRPLNKVEAAAQCVGA
jgi:hypothetical protein